MAYNYLPKNEVRDIYPLLLMGILGHIIKGVLYQYTNIKMNLRQYNLLKHYEYYGVVKRFSLYYPFDIRYMFYITAYNCIVFVYEKHFYIYSCFS